jgi:glycosidase
MFGEAWVNSTVSEAYFTRNTINTPFKSNLISVTDFPSLFSGIMPALKQEDGANSLYQTLSNDILYENPMNNVIFLDNHDMTRFYSAINEDTAKLRIGLAWLMTERGIPQMYYGTEILMKGVSDPDALVRKDFPGGFQGDIKNAFTGQGMNEDELAILNYTRTLANFRKSSSAITNGQLMQYVPDDGLYVYFRYDTAQTIMCVMNLNNNSKEIFFSNYVERTKGFSSGRNVVTGETVSNPFTLPGKTMWVLELQK